MLIIWDELKSLCLDHNIQIEKVVRDKYQFQISLEFIDNHVKLLDDILALAKDKITNLLLINYDESFLFFTFEQKIENLLMSTQDDVFDFATFLSRDSINNLLDGKGFVKLLDFHPRHVPKGRTPEYLIVHAARTSITVSKTLRSKKMDENLLKYLNKNKHTSPFEMCNVTLSLMLPLPIAVQFLRHRTGKFNQFSQRYAEVTDELGNYNPLLFAKGIRIQDTFLNKQSSMDDTKHENIEEITKILEEQLKLQESILNNYHKLIKLGLAKEIARFFLPQNQYTKLVMQFDLNNLIKLLRLRQDSHAQLEIQIFANAIADLTRPLFPITFQAYENEKQSLYLTENEIDAIANKKDLNSSSKSDKTEFDSKKRKLNLSGL